MPITPSQQWVLGKTFNDLTVLELTKLGTWTAVKCRCLCGAEKVVRLTRVLCGHAKSCGCRKHLKKSPVSPGFTALCARYKYRARSLKLKFSLSRDQLLKLFQEPCSYCGSLPSAKSIKTGTTGFFVYNGIDRVDNAQGYTEDNVVACCRQCNIAKRCLSRKDFYRLIGLIYENCSRTGLLRPNGVESITQ
jgi:hypothetical protein